MPKRYVFTLILMWFISVLFFCIIFKLDSIKYYGCSLFYFFVFIVSFLLMFYLVTHYLEKVNLIRIYSLAFYLTLFLLLYFFYVHLSVKALPIGIEGKKLYNYMMTTHYIMSGYCFFVFCFLIIHTSYLVFRKKLKNISAPVALFTRFIIFWSLIFIISFPIMIIYIVKYLELFAEN